MRPSLRASSGSWPARVLTVLALVLPIPLCAALGLSLPLPATVARIAAKLVPFGNSAVLDAKEEQLLGARGSIVRSPGEPGGNVGSALDPGASLAVLGPHNGGAAGVPGTKVDGSTTVSPNGTTTIPADPQARPTLVDNSTSTPSTGSTPPTGGGGGGPVPPSTPPTVVDTATAAAASVVGTVTTTAAPVTTTVAGTAAPVVGAVTGVVAPVLPPKP
jgi:hypothetical protein